MEQETNLREKKARRKNKEKPILTETEIKQRKARKTKIAAASFVLILALGIMGNWYYQNTDLSANIQPLIDSTQTKVLGEAEFVGGTAEAQENTESKYFSTARVNRQNSRDESLDKLQKVIDSAEENSEAKKQASAEIARISDNISIENKIETLVSAKGVDNCLAVVSLDGQRVDIIVNCEELSDSLIIQIKEIAMQQLSCSFENVSIIQSKQ